MPSALAFIGGGLLEGIGKGLVLDGKAKREAALKKIEDERQQKNRLELEDVRLEGRRGLLGTEIDARKTAAETANKRAKDAAKLTAGAKVKASTAATGVATTAADALNTRKVEAAKLKRESAKEVAKIRAGKATDTTAAEDRIIERHVEVDEFGQKTDAVDHEAAAVELEERGFKKAAAAQRRKGKGIADLEIRRRAEQFADETVEEQSSFALPDAIDFKDDGGSRVRFRARMVREFIAKNSGQPAPAPATKPAETTPPAETKPPAPADDPYVGAAPPPDHPDAKRARDGFWYVKRDGKFLRVQNSEDNRVSRLRRRPR